MFGWLKQKKKKEVHHYCYRCNKGIEYDETHYCGATAQTSQKSIDESIARMAKAIKDIGSLVVSEENHHNNDDDCRRPTMATTTRKQRKRESNERHGTEFDFFE